MAEFKNYEIINKKKIDFSASASCFQKLFFFTYNDYCFINPLKVQFKLQIFFFIYSIQDLTLQLLIGTTL